MSNKRPPFEPDTVFHVYNHGNAGDNIFREKQNYYYFLKRYAHYIYPVARTYAFCLLPNHFHWMIKIRNDEVLRSFFEKKGKDLAGLVSKQFSNLLNAYTKAFNNRYDRKGKLFLNSLERKPVKNKIYYKKLIYYIHHNPVNHGFVENAADWPFSSYSIVLSRKLTQLDRTIVLKWFGGRGPFLEFHQKRQEINWDEFY